MNDDNGAGKTDKDGADPSCAQPLAKQHHRQQCQDHRLREEDGDRLGHRQMLERGEEEHRRRRQQQTTHRLQDERAGRHAPQTQHDDEGQHQNGLHEKAPEGDFEWPMRDPQQLGENVKKGNDQHAGAKLQRAKRVIRSLWFRDFHAGILHGNSKQGQSNSWVVPTAPFTCSHKVAVWPVNGQTAGLAITRRSPRLPVTTELPCPLLFWKNASTVAYA